VEAVRDHVAAILDVLAHRRLADHAIGLLAAKWRDELHEFGHRLVELALVLQGLARTEPRWIDIGADIEHRPGQPVVRRKEFPGLAGDWGRPFSSSNGRSRPDGPCIHL